MMRVYAVACVQFVRLKDQDDGTPDLERQITKTVAVEGYAEAAIARVKELVDAEPERADGATVTGFEVVTVTLQNVAE